MQFEVLRPAQEKGDISIGYFVFNQFADGMQEPAQFGNADDAFIEIRYEANDLQFFDELPLCSDKVIAQNVYFLGLPLSLFVEPMDQQP